MLWVNLFGSVSMVNYRLNRHTVNANVVHSNWTICFVVVFILVKCWTLTNEINWQQANCIVNNIIFDCTYIPQTYIIGEKLVVFWLFFLHHCSCCWFCRFFRSTQSLCHFNPLWLLAINKFIFFVAPCRDGKREGENVIDTLVAFRMKFQASQYVFI